MYAQLLSQLPHITNQEELLNTVQPACKEMSRNICLVFMALNPYHITISPLGSESSVAPAGEFMEVYLKTLDICQVGRHSVYGK